LKFGGKLAKPPNFSLTAMIVFKPAWLTVNFPSGLISPETGSVAAVYSSNAVLVVQSLAKPASPSVPLLKLLPRS
jgi:hypothetical protein